MSEQPESTPPESPPAPPPGTGWRQLVGVIVMVVAGMIGQGVGGQIGESYEGYGQATGLDIGGWFGWFAGAWLGMTAYGIVASFIWPQMSPLGATLRVALVLLPVLFFFGAAGAAGHALYGTIGGIGMMVVAFLLLMGGLKLFGKRVT